MISLTTSSTTDPCNIKHWLNVEGLNGRVVKVVYFWS